MKYRHAFTICAPLAAVADFHQQSASMGAITPPPVRVQIHAAPERLASGDEMDFTLWLSLLPIRWLAHIEEVSSTGFTDRQLRGPLKRWIHRHTFVPLDETKTEIIDEIQLELKLHPVWGLVGLGMWLSLPLMFAYRGWKTRRFLEDEKKCAGS